MSFFQKSKFQKIQLLVLLTFTTLVGYTQVDYQRKIESGFLNYQRNIIDIDPGPNWQGYNLDGQNGLDFNLINGIEIRNKFFGGIGVGYLNFEGIEGFSVFTDFQYFPFETRLKPLANIKIGYNHIWNQYENGTGSALSELAMGASFGVTEKLEIYLQSGILITQQSLLIPLRIGLKF